MGMHNPAVETTITGLQQQDADRARNVSIIAVAARRKSADADPDVRSRAPPEREGIVSS